MAWRLLLRLASSVEIACALRQFEGMRDIGPGDKVSDVHSKLNGAIGRAGLQRDQAWPRSRRAAQCGARLLPTACHRAKRRW